MHISKVTIYVMRLPMHIKCVFRCTNYKILENLLLIIFSYFFFNLFSNLRKEKKKNTKKKKVETRLSAFKLHGVRRSLTFFFGVGDRVRYRSLFFSQGRPPGA